MPGIGSWRHVVTVENPGAAVPDGDGGYTQTPAPADPALWDCSIAPATQRDLERVAAGTVITSASHVVRGPYHPGITSQSRLIFEGRALHVVSVANVDELNDRLELVCTEVVD